MDITYIPADREHLIAPFGDDEYWLRRGPFPLSLRMWFWILFMSVPVIPAVWRDVCSFVGVWVNLEMVFNLSIWQVDLAPYSWMVPQDVHPILAVMLIWVLLSCFLQRCLVSVQVRVDLDITRDASEETPKQVTTDVPVSGPVTEIKSAPLPSPRRFAELRRQWKQAREARMAELAKRRTESRRDHQRSRGTQTEKSGPSRPLVDASTQTVRGSATLQPVVTICAIEPFEEQVLVQPQLTVFGPVTTFDYPATALEVVVSNVKVYDGALDSGSSAVAVILVGDRFGGAEIDSDEEQVDYEGSSGSEEGEGVNEDAVAEYDESEESGEEGAIVEAAAPSQEPSVGTLAPVLHRPVAKVFSQRRRAERMGVSFAQEDAGMEAAALLLSMREIREEGVNVDAVAEGVDEESDEDEQGVNGVAVAEGEEGEENEESGEGAIVEADAPELVYGDDTPETAVMLPPPGRRIAVPRSRIRSEFTFSFSSGA
ncbi:hypothetical protein TWF694_000736 [Orbilia ellipsospora]|uniref:Transmembrane protein n=1 Tax=Orbilia ellipsospora TaxID=2528407 RepID=A0AAV9XPH7_9PEZI